MSERAADVAERRDDAPVTASKDTHPDRALLGEVVTIARPAQELYDYWRHPAKLASILENVVAIEQLDEKRSQWTVKVSGGNDVLGRRDHA